MVLRTSGDIPSASTERPLRRFRLLAVLAGAVVVLLTAFAGGSGAGISNYQGTLYLSGAPSAIGGSFQLLTTAGPGGAGVAPVAIAGPLGSGGITGTYSYVYVRTGGSGARSASASSPPVAVNNAPMTVNNVPVGSALYRQKSSSGSYVLIDPSTAVTPYVDTNPDPAAGTAVLGNAENRLAAGTGNVYVDFSPGVAPSSTIANTPPMSSLTPSIPGTCKGWTVDAAAGFSFPSGPWAFTVAVKSNGSASGAAYLLAGMWKVDAAGAPIAGGTILNPVTAADGSQNLITAGATTQTITYPAPASTVTLPSFTLASNERLCIQFWRHQTTAYAGGGFSNRTLGLLPDDNSNPAQVTHPAPNSFAAATLSSPVDGLHTTSIPTLGATYSDPDGDAGNLTIQLCMDAGCTSTVSSGPLAATNGATPTWTPPGPLADGQYWWQAQAQDTLGLPSAWTASRTFYIDNVAPTTNLTSSPTALSNASSGSFSFLANEPVTGYQCRIGAAAFAACTSPYSYGPLVDGAHTFDVKATADLAGNPGTTTNYSWTIDTVPSDTSITSQPVALSNSASPSFGLSATEPGSTFECALDGGFAACSTPKSYSGVADGPHTFQARAVDPAGNVDPSPASYSWTIDATPPDTTIGPSYPAALTIATGATFDFSSSESPSTYACALDAGAYSSCSSPKTYSGLADGAHTFYVRATDAATNTDPSPATYNWTIDTTPPSTTIGPTMPTANTQSSSAAFDLGSNEPSSTFECRLDGALFASCATPASYSGLGDGTHTFDVRATDPAGNLDTSPAAYSWKIDNLAPSTPTLTAPADALMTNALPQLRATFDDATAGGDTGTVEFQFCSSSAPAGVSCAPVVQSVTSGSVSTGGTASATPAALADGTYSWQAQAHDVAGNQSGWSATRSFQLDTSVPTVPALSAPADDAWVHTIQLSA
ncbi:MAG TPA: Ig-like domain-containing protein, partial [Gaiellaceae bacterium]